MKTSRASNSRCEFYDSETSEVEPSKKTHLVIIGFLGKFCWSSRYIYMLGAAFNTIGGGKNMYTFI